MALFWEYWADEQTSEVRQGWLDMQSQVAQTQSQVLEILALLKKS